MRATTLECFEIRAKKFERLYGYLPPGKSSPTARASDPDSENYMEAFREDRKKLDAIPCICGTEIPENWSDSI